MTIADRKAALRSEALARRLTLDAGWAGRALAEHALREWPWPRDAIVGGTWPLRGEIDLRPLILALHDRGHAIVLPETPPPGRMLTFRQWCPGCRMAVGRFGTRHPDGPEAIPDIILVPLLAFDRAGHRLGYGGGYYDRTLAGLVDATPLGTAFAAQEVDAVPVERHDRRLGTILTDRGVLTFDPSAQYTEA